MPFLHYLQNDHNQYYLYAQFENIIGTISKIFGNHRHNSLVPFKLFTLHLNNTYYEDVIKIILEKTLSHPFKFQKKNINKTDCFVILTPP